LIEPAPGQRTEALEMRFEPLKIIGLQIKREQTAQAAIDRIKILPGAIQGEMTRATIEILRVVERFV
jgi:hypothetical protein